MVVLPKLSKLAPKQFENLIYDLLIRRGLINVCWRTPGVDGGRDIQGEFPIQDFSGSSRVEKWYVECKRYTSAIDWPTVKDKLAYAHNHGADFLLLCTTSFLSPRCKDEVNTRDGRNERPRIRYWEGADLEILISNDSVLKSKYGLSREQHERELSALFLLSLVTKTMHQIYGETSMHGHVTPSIEFAAAASEYATLWVQTPYEDRIRLRHRISVDRDLYPWAHLRGNADFSQWDSYPLRTLLTGVRMITAAPKLDVTFEQGPHSRNLIRISPVPRQSAKAGIELLNIVTQLSNWEWSISNDALTITQRT